jgi:broad specificity phosphatase PhoE
VKPTFIFLIRHGQSLGNVDKNIYLTVPDYKVELTDRGKEQAKAAALEIQKKLSEHSIKKAAMYCSPFYRTRQTADPIRELIDIDYKEDPRIREQECGNYKDLAASIRIDKEREKYGRFFIGCRMGNLVRMSMIGFPHS